MKKLILAFTWLFACDHLYSQVLSEDFSDNDLGSSPEWFGDTSHFMINNAGQLQLNMSVADTSALITGIELLSEMEWRFHIRLNFSPSSSNYCKVFLFSDQPYLVSPLNGYFLRFGEAGSNDAIELFRQQGTTITSIARSANGSISSAFSLNIRITKDENETWNIYSSSSQAYQLIATGTSNATTGTGYFGIQCFYTSSNASRFYFDNIYAGPVQPDTIPPKLDSVKIIDERNIILSYSEPLDSTRFTSQTFHIQGHQGTLSITGESSDPGKFNLSLSDPLVNGNTYSLIVDTVYDLNENFSDTTIQFTLFKPARFDVVINEIMVDPTPSQGIPEHEFIELHNKTGYEIDLHGWSVKIGSTIKQINNASVPAHGFILLVSQASAADFELLGNRSVVAGLSTTALTNSGSTIILSDPQGEIIDYMSYDLSTYKNEVKSEGGYSLERIDPSNNCGGKKNWTATISREGGTPGIPNSVLNPSAPVGFNLESLCFIDQNKIELGFSQFIDTSGMARTAIFSISPQVGFIMPVASERFTDRLILETVISLSDLSNYVLDIQGLNSCDGSSANMASVSFSTQTPSQGSIVINEIMADPDPRKALPSAEYVEIVNNSNRALLTGGLKFCTNTGCGIVTCGIINPGEYVIMSDIQHIETFKQYGKTIGVTDMPSLSNEGTTLSLNDKNDNVIATVTYTSDWYNNDAKSEGGYSLEQIDLLNPCAGASNWKASESPGGGSPGRQNSVSSVNSDSKAPFIKYASIRDSSHVLLIFSEPILVKSVPTTSILIDHSIGNPVSITPSNKRLDTYMLSLQNKLEHGIIYNISLNSGKDCAGNDLSVSSVRVAYPEKAEEHDLVFNEILFDGHTSDAEYFEIYNKSEKPVSLSSIHLSDLDTITNTLSSERAIDTTGYVVFPGEYICITNTIDDLCSVSRCNVPEKIISAFENLDLNNDGSVALVSIEGKIIDQFRYDESMHFPLLTSTKGVSLEKIDPTTSSLQRSVWHSASSRSGWGTPGYKNSQLQVSSEQEAFNIYPEVISPDNDGLNDLLNIEFHDLVPGTLANVFIFSATGLICRSLVQNEICGSSGIYFWDGTNDAGEMSGRGIYIVYFETFDPLGTVKKQKKICVLHRGD